MLENTLYKLTKEKKLNIAYFGGSVTEGAGASDENKTSWRGRTTQWFRDTYPDAEINEIQAAVGGTGTGLGIYRCDRDMADKLPDLVFFEFSINDCGGKFATLTSNAETIIRKVWKKVPTADIIITHTITKSISGSIEKGNDFGSKTAFSAVAYHYGLPIVDFGEHFRHRIKEEGGDWLKYTIEGVHPNDEGYAIYANCIIGAITKYFEKAAVLDAPAVKILPENQLSSAPLKLEARLEDSYLADLGEGWSKVEADLCSRYPHYIEATEPGSRLTFSFTGKTVGAYWMIATDGGFVEYTIDGVHTGKAQCWDGYATQFNRGGDVIFAADLEYGEHTIEIKLTGEKSELSKGCACRIGAFMVS
ncbi:MAG: SGNH/GDSL hydrolase family protein [Clostridia bacterium]|nr:SGNH/GDSL hydrolase family protein [Clostridia bacterium]